MLELAIRAAREAGAILQDYAARGFQIEHKGRINLVTEADLASEQYIKRLIASHYPTHRILAEESSERAFFGRILLDHRSARRHDQLLARVSLLRRLD